MMKKSNQEGFTLVEVIISIAVLSIVSVFILQMFVTSTQLNDNARDVDKVNMWTSTLMETFHLQDDPLLFGENGVFTYAATEPTEDGLIITCYFDTDWNPVESGEARDFTLKATVAHEEEGSAVPTGLAPDAPVVRGVLYSLSLEFFHLDANGNDVRLGMTQNSNYFLLEEAAQ